MFNELKKIISKINLELIFWVAGFIFLMQLNPNDSHHYSFCIFKNLGIEFCPGCGLGKSISYFFRGEFSYSIKAHPLGIPAILILSYRISQLFAQSFVTIKNKSKD